MLRPATLATLLTVTLATAGPSAAQFGNIFGNNPPRPPGNVGPTYQDPIQDPDADDVPDIPQGRVLPAPMPTRPPPGAALPPPVQSQPLAPPPGTAAAPPQRQPDQPGVATAPNPLPGLPPGQRQPRPAPGSTPPPPAATIQPGDEVVTAPPAQKVVNKQATFSGLDKITGRIIKFDVDIGETVQFGALRVKPQACYTRPATEAANTDAFVEVEEITLQGEVKRIFSGWMFAASPGLHGVEHPIYDVWLTDCKGPETTVAGNAPEPPRSAPPPAQQKRTAPRPQRSQQQQPPQLPPFR